MKKIITFLLIAALSSSAAVMAQETADTPVLIEATEGDAAVQNQASYIRVTAGAAKISELDGAKFIEAVDSNGEPVEIVVGDDTLVIGENGEAVELVDGMQFTVFVHINKPMVLSMPPRYHADVVVVDTDLEMLVDVDTYKADGDSFVNAANTLAIITGEAELADSKGEKFEGELDGRDLVVFYDISTRSIPAQTNPKKVIVLDELVEEVPVTAVAVGDKTFDIVEKAGIEVLPVRAVSEALGLEVKWDNDLQAVTVGTVPMGVNFIIGVNSYNKARMTPFTLEGAPYLEMTETGGVTYVPVSFFTDVLGCAVENADGVMTLTF